MAVAVTGVETTAIIRACIALLAVISTANPAPLGTGSYVTSAMKLSVQLALLSN